MQRSWRFMLVLGSKMQKGFSLIFILVGIAVIAIGVGGTLLYTNYSNNQYKNTTPNPIVTSQTPRSTPSTIDETVYTEGTRSANWKIYTNTLLGMTFQYPENWQVQTYQSRDQEEFSHRAFDLLLASNSKIYLGSVYYYNNPNQLSLDAFEKLRKQKEKSNLVPPLVSASDEMMKLQDNTSIFFRKNSVCEPVDCQVYILPYKDKIFIFQNFQFNQIPNQDGTFRQILSTFKFLDQNK